MFLNISYYRLHCATNKMEKVIIDDEHRPQNIMWDVLRSADAGSETAGISILLYSHGLASEEYLCFCDDATLDELSSCLKPVPRRMFEYYRSKLCQPYRSLEATSTEKLTTVDWNCLGINCQVAGRNEGHHALSDKVYEPDTFYAANSFESCTTEMSTVCLDAEDDGFDERRERNPRIENTTSKSHFAKSDGNLSLFLSDLRIASHDCSDEIATFYLEIFGDDVEGAVAAFLASDQRETQQTSLQLLPEATKSVEMFVTKVHNTFTVENTAANKSFGRHDDLGDELNGYSVKQLKEAIAVLGGSCVGLVEKSELRERLQELQRTLSATKLSSLSADSKRPESVTGLGSAPASGSRSGHLAAAASSVTGVRASSASGGASGTATKNKDVFAKLQQFGECKRAIDKTWAGISSGRLETIRSVDAVQNADGTWNFTLRQQSLRGPPVESLDELYESAESANPIFNSSIQTVIAAAGLPMTCLHMAPLKGRPRAAEKAKDDYDERERGHGERWLFDIVRGAVLCDTEEQLTRMIERLLGSTDTEVIRLKNRFATPIPSGFRDFNLNIRIRINAHVCHICELQVHCAAIKKMGEVKLSHKIYEYFRTYFRGETKSVDERLKVLEQVAGSLATAGATLETIVESAVSSNDLDQLENVSALLDLLSEYEHNIRIRRTIVSVAQDLNGSHHVGTICKINNLAILLKNSGKMAEARALYERAVRDCETVLGPEHQYTLTTVCNLASLLRSLHETVNARALYERALRGYERALGPEHPDTLNAVGSLANSLNDLGEWGEARALYERALRGKEKVMGPEHPSTLHSVNDLALLLRALGKFVEARSLIERVLREREKIFGAEHPETLQTINSLAAVLFDLGERAGLIPLYERALRGFEKVLGPDHSETLASVNNLAAVLTTLGKMAEARPLYERALRGCEAELGPEHPDTLQTVSNLGFLLLKLGKKAESKTMCERALRGFKKVLGPKHPQTLHAERNFSVFV